MNISTQLKSIRQKMGKTQKELASELGLPQQTWANYETGRSEPSVEIIAKLQKMGHTIKGLDGAANDAIRAVSEKTGLPKEEIERRVIAHIQELAKNFPPDTPIEQLPKPNFAPLSETANFEAKRRANTIAAIAMLENVVKSLEATAQSIESAIQLLKENIGE